MPKNCRPRPVSDECFENDSGVLVPRTGAVAHEAEEYDPRGFAVLRRMQRDHFWYRGRHRFVRAAVRRELGRARADAGALSAIDLGGGCGGWVSYLCEHGPVFGELGLADSSRDALRFARETVPGSVACYHASIYDLPWDSRWDVVFLLDVIEHLADDVEALRHVVRTVRTGGWIIVTVPALMSFWSYVDEIGGHRRRYTCDDLTRLGRNAHLEVVDTRYFMFLLSPMLWLSRRQQTTPGSRSDGDLRQMAERAHRVPPRAVNATLAAVFGAETPAGLYLRFPWGTSALAIYRRS